MKISVTVSKFYSCKCIFKSLKLVTAILKVASCWGGRSALVHGLLRRFTQGPWIEYAPLQLRGGHITSDLLPLFCVNLVGRLIKMLVINNNNKDAESLKTCGCVLYCSQIVYIRPYSLNTASACCFVNECSDILSSRCVMTQRIRTLVGCDQFRN